MSFAPCSCPKGACHHPGADICRRWKAYRALGIDPEHPNPDGSDYHLMDLLDLLDKE